MIKFLLFCCSLSIIFTVTGCFLMDRRLSKEIEYIKKELKYLDFVKMANMLNYVYLHKCINEIEENK